MYPAGTRSVIVQITDSFSVTVIVGYPNVPVQVDDQIYLDRNKWQGVDECELGRTSYLDPIRHNASRTIRVQSSANGIPPHLLRMLDLSVSRDVSLLAIYQRQYYLKVTSQLDQASGTGWYDEDSIAEVYVAPFLVLEGKTFVFAGWTGDSNDSMPVIYRLDE